VNSSEVTRVHEWFTRQAAATPEAVALVAGSRRVSYRELDRRANAVARHLVDTGTGAGSLVGVYLDRDELLAASLLGVWKAGAGYVPLDPAYPAARLRFIAEDTGLTQVLTSTARRGDAAATGAVCVAVDELPVAADDPDVPGEPGDCAYVLYTSGSTGAPKGVVVEHRQVVNLLQWATQAYAPSELAGTLVATSVCFDVSVVELFAPLVCGGTAILAEDLLALPRLPARDQVRLVCGVPSALAALVRLGLPAGVRTVAPAGEALPRALVDQLYAQPGVNRVLNCFGPTECTVYCAAHEVGRDAPGAPPIGAAIAGARLSVRDPETCDPAGEGELWVAGPVVARGYLNRPELTAQRFVTTGDGQRWYRTGDLVRLDGDIHHYLGRLDDQVKVRGHRVELGEVQATLSAHPDVHHAVVLAPPDGDGTRHLIGYVEPVAAPPSEQQLRAWLRERLPAYLLPSRLVVLERLPLGPTGKVDRAALPVPAAHRSAAGPPVPSRNPTEALVAEVIADVLGLPEVGVEDQFGELGGHSLAAARVVARVAERLHRPVPLGWFLTEPTVAALARRLTGPDAAPAGPDAGPDAAAVLGPVRHPGRRVYPLTDLQREFWVARRVRPQSSTTVAIRMRLSGPVDADRVRAALAATVRRHEVLRTGVEEWDDGPVAVVRPPAPVPVAEIDLTGAAPVDQPIDAAAAMATAAGYVFDLAGDAPLIRGTVIRTAATDTELVIAVDHIAFDGWSIGVLMSELTAALASRSVPEPPLQVGDVALFERAMDDADVEMLRGFWRRTLAGVTVPEALSGRRGEQRSGRGARVVQLLPADLVRAMDDATRTCGVSRFAGYAAALAVLLHRLTGSPDVLIGTGSALRDRPGLEQLIGPLVRVLPIRVPVTGDPTLRDPTLRDPTFRDLTARVTAAATEALTHQDLTTGDLARCADVDRPPGAGLCPVVLTMQPEDMPVTVEAGDIRVELAGELATGMATTELAFFVNQVAAVRGAPAVEVQVEYDLGLYRPDEVQALVDLWLRVLRQLATDPDRSTAAVELLDADQQRTLLAQGRGPALPADRPATVVAAIDAHAHARPDVVAVTGPDGELTYAQLVATAQRLAAALAAAGVRPGDRVGVCLPRDRWLPAALLGVLRAGAAYVPLDAEHPPERLALLAADCEVAVVVSRAEALAVAGQIPGVRVLDLDGVGDGDPPPAPDAADLAYVLFTSGSTGRPKGVEVSHANLADHTTALRVAFDIGPDDAVLAMSAVSFDAVGLEIWSPLAAGARCVVVPRDRVPDGPAIVARLTEAKTTIAFLPPAMLRILLASGWTGDPHLTVWSGGEPVDPALVREVLPLVGQLWNVYGPTETTTLSTAYRVTGAPDTGASDTGTVPIGTPLPGEWVYVMNPDGTLAPPGRVGELWIGGAGVARGYRGRPELSATAFVPDPYLPPHRCYRTGDLVRWNAEAELEFIGRTDHQVKLRGQRIELGEIEAVLHDHPDVTQAVVVVHGEGASGALVGYLVPATVDTDHVNRFLRARLPEYMVPTRWVQLARMPITTSGKVDRRALPAPSPESAGGPPGTELERFLAEVWGEVLEAAEVGRGSDFFALGGNSFAATRVVARLRTVLGCDIPVALLFDRPSLADLAEAVEKEVLDQLAGDMTTEGTHR
jgi:amino acid adenylation domain-containing protein